MRCKHTIGEADIGQVAANRIDSRIDSRGVPGKRKALTREPGGRRAR